MSPVPQTPAARTGFPIPLPGALARVEARLRRAAATRGAPFLVAWAHRLSGAALAAYMVAHLSTLAALQQPERFGGLMQAYRSWPFVLAEWALAIPVIFHALNGGRLILFESFGGRQDDRLIRWAAVGSAVYVGVLTVAMLLGDQAVSTAVFWLCAVSAATCLTAVAAGPIRRSGPGRGWKLQRLSAAWLLLMVPAHMLFMHLNPAAGHDPQVILARLSHPLMKLLDLTLVLAVLGHGAWGLWSITGDYLARGPLRAAVGTLLLAGGAWLAWLGLRLTLTL